MALMVESPKLRPVLRPDLGGIMVLPVNWRAIVELDEGKEEVLSGSETSKEPTLADITAPTIPGIREVINDVMLDIPYYMSHHKPAMIEATIKEANRVYLLWCKNNAGFQENGRVHILAHSLGRVMASSAC